MACSLEKSATVLKLVLSEMFQHKGHFTLRISAPPGHEPIDQNFSLPSDVINFLLIFTITSCFSPQKNLRRCLHPALLATRTFLQTILSSPTPSSKTSKTYFSLKSQRCFKCRSTTRPSKYEDSFHGPPFYQPSQTDLELSQGFDFLTSLLS